MFDKYQQVSIPEFWVRSLSLSFVIGLTSILYLRILENEAPGCKLDTAHVDRPASEVDQEQ